MRDPGWDRSLTRVERRTALLVAWGGTNKQVAAATGRPVGTIARQLTRIYAKLAIASRVQLASLVLGGATRDSPEANEPHRVLPSRHDTTEGGTR